MSKNSQINVATFPGCTTQDRKDHIKPLLRRNPDEIIIHVGTNSLHSFNTPLECVAELIDLAESAPNLQLWFLYPVSSPDLMMKPWPLN